MLKLFDEVGSLDKRCYEKFFLSEDLLMEHAANSIYEYINLNFDKNKSILIVCGSGNNGADGIVLGRLLYKKFDVKLFFTSEAKSKMAQLQFKRIKALGVPIVKELFEADIIVDCIFGTGLNKGLNKKYVNIIKILNTFKSFKIACDIPSGINSKGQVENIAFLSDLTITMGALKISLFSDTAKDFVGDILVAELGIQRIIYETKSKKYLLEASDMILPFREYKNTHKGTYGHLNVFAGCKRGAGILAAKAAFAFGSGLVSIVCHENLEIPEYLMKTHSLSKNCTALAIGMGLGKYDKEEMIKILNNDIKKLIDADLFYDEIILEALDQELVLTPHPKEFISLLKLTKLANISVEELQNNRFFYVEKFCKKYKKTVLLLKGANVIIGQNETLFVNPFGNPVLSKGGSGDVLSGLISSLLAQGYEVLEAAISGSLAHSLAAEKFSKNNYSMSPLDLIEEIKTL